MTVLMHDAKRELRAHPAYRSQPPQPIEELLYADDTLLIHSDPAIVKAYMECVRAAGSTYGLLSIGKSWGACLLDAMRSFTHLTGIQSKRNPLSNISAACSATAANQAQN